MYIKYLTKLTENNDFIQLITNIYQLLHLFCQCNISRIQFIHIKIIVPLILKYLYFKYQLRLKRNMI